MKSITPAALLRTDYKGASLGVGYHNDLREMMAAWTREVAVEKVIRDWILDIMLRLSHGILAVSVRERAGRMELPLTKLEKIVGGVDQEGD